MKMTESYPLLAGAFVACLVIRTGYELLKEGRKIDPEDKRIFVLIFATMCALWACWFSLCPLDPFKINLPAAIQWSGLVLVVIGVIFAVGALLQLRGLENIKHLVTSGLFKKIRHPMYAGFVLWILGWSTYHRAMVSLFVGLVGIANILFWRRLEEARLLAQHGEAYLEYRVTTWL
jgi:protein-S-isoprenylcysteine O-methyltransferase Ste14